ncbi:MAG: serine/threonine protein kinase [Mariniblastus sp.]|jgi:serine/threonine protein kinase
MNSKLCSGCGQASDDEELCLNCQNEVTLAAKPATTGDDDITLPRQGNAVEASNGIADGSDTSSSLSGMRLGDYDLLEELARGGMGVVYRARDRKLNRDVAIKMIIGGQFSSPADIQRFYVEAEAAAKLDHPGIVPIYAIDSFEGRPFFAMKLIEGGSLADHLSRFTQKTKNAVEVVSKVAWAVHHAHQRGILHRDIKPANILLDAKDQPWLTDLGLAKSTADDSKLTQTGAVLGTPSYMPPEQAGSSQSLTTGGDIYSIGAILYELLVGRPPHRGSTPLETVIQVLNDPVKAPRSIDPNIDRDLELICLKCLQRQPENRYASAGQLADDLERWLVGGQISIRPATLRSRATLWVKHNQRVFYAVLLLIVGVMFSTPLLLSLLGSLDDPALLYSGTDEDPRPLVFSFTNLPSWLSILSLVTIVSIWPILGVLVTIVTTPKSIMESIFNGLAVGGATALLLVLLLGGVLFILGSQASSNQPVRLLAESVWPNPDSSPDHVESELIKLYPMLNEIPDNEKVNYVSNRVFADGVAVGPLIILVLVLIGLIWGVPVVTGAAIGFILRQRQQAWWIFWPRYLIAWLSSFMMILIYLSVAGGGNFNGKRFGELPLITRVLMLTLPLLLTILVLRKWKKTKTSTTPDALNQHA